MWSLLAVAFAIAPQPDGRFLVATELLVPGVEWFNDQGSFGFETRSWQLRAVIRCTSTPEGKRLLVRCEVEDAALQASAFQRTSTDDPAKTAKVLSELSGRLRGMAITTVLTNDGRMKSWSTENRPVGSLRERDTGYLLELMFERSLAPLWIVRPKDAFTVGQQWVESNRSPLFAFPRVHGLFSSGTTEVLHQVGRVTDTVVVDVVGEGTMVSEAIPQLRARGKCREVYEPGGALLKRSWSVDGTLIDTVSYHYAGWLVRLGPETGAIDLGPIRQVRGPGEPPEADLPGLPEWPDLVPPS